MWTGNVVERCREPFAKVVTFPFVPTPPVLLWGLFNHALCCELGSEFWRLFPSVPVESWVCLSFLGIQHKNQMLLICMSLNLTLCHKVLWFWSIFLLFAATGKHHTCVRCEGINWEAVLSVVSVNLRPACSRTGQSIAEKSSSLSAAIISL